MKWAWLMRLVTGAGGNVIRERSTTNWNRFDASEIVAEKKREQSRPDNTATMKRRSS